MKRPRLRSILAMTAFLAVVTVAWCYLAPTTIGGSTRYVVTGGVSMEPRFHTGDLAVVRPAGQYKVGDVAAYWSTLLHTVVLHRIHAIDGNTYIFKGDNNDFLDPTHPTRADLLGKLWLHMPGGGAWLKRVHSPAGIAVICVLLATLVLFGVGEEKRRRRKRRRKDAPGSLRQGIQPVNNPPDQSVGRRINFGAFLTASAAAAAVFVVLGVVGFTRPATRMTAGTTPYKQKVSFGYSANAPVGPVYQTGTVRTGDPIFTSLVHQLAVDVDWSFASTNPHDIRGTERILLRLTAQGGWSRSMVLTPTTRFVGDHTGTTVTLNLPQVQSLIARVSRLTGMEGFTIAVAPQVHITGSVAGHPLNLSFNPALKFQIENLQLVPVGTAGTASGASAAGVSAAGLIATRNGGVGTPGTAPASITALGVSAQVSLLRWISIVGVALSAIAVLFFYLRKRGEPFEESFRIQSQYGHMIVPIVGGEDLGWPPVDVPNIKALVMLAESGQRLILHNRKDNVDTYMVNEEGTVYRYQVKPSNVVWGEWSDTSTPAQAAA